MWHFFFFSPILFPILLLYYFIFNHYCSNLTDLIIFNEKLNIYINDIYHVISIISFYCSWKDFYREVRSLPRTSKTLIVGSINTPLRGNTTKKKIFNDINTMTVVAGLSSNTTRWQYCKYMIWKPQYFFAKTVVVFDAVAVS